MIPNFTAVVAYFWDVISGLIFFLFRTNFKGIFLKYWQRFQFFGELFFWSDSFFLRDFMALLWFMDTKTFLLWFTLSSFFATHTRRGWMHTKISEIRGECIPRYPRYIQMHTEIFQFHTNLCIMLTKLCIRFYPTHSASITLHPPLPLCSTQRKFGYLR